jgi:hypothetical protein
VNYWLKEIYERDERSFHYFQYLLSIIFVIFIWKRKFKKSAKYRKWWIGEFHVIWNPLKKFLKAINEMEFAGYHKIKWKYPFISCRFIQKYCKFAKYLFQLLDLNIFWIIVSQPDSLHTCYNMEGTFLHFLLKLY